MIELDSYSQGAPENFNWELLMKMDGFWGGGTIHKARCKYIQEKISNSQKNISVTFKNLLKIFQKVDDFESKYWQPCNTTKNNEWMAQTGTSILQWIENRMQ